MEEKQKANELRRAGHFEEALQIYRKLWKANQDEFCGAGFLHCLRKLELFDDAIKLANELIEKFPAFNWIRLEVIWTYISGILDRFEDNEPLENIVQIAQKIMGLNAEGIAANKVVLKVLKAAKAAKEWEILNDWAEKVDPNSLSTTPMTDGKGKEIWSQQNLWYLYRITGLLQKEEENKVIELVDKILDLFPKQQKFFLRLKAQALIQLKNFSEAEKIYQNLCYKYKMDWWLVHEYAKLLRLLGQKENALKLMYQSANTSPKLEPLLTLFADIGTLCQELSKNEEARAHFILSRYIRTQHNWTVPPITATQIAELDEIIGNNNDPNSLEEALNICRRYWKSSLDMATVSASKLPEQRKSRKSLSGKIDLGHADRYYCFITAENGESFFCLKSDLPPQLNDGDLVTFEAIPSFDKKKNQESWKAIHIQPKK